MYIRYIYVGTIFNGIALKPDDNDEHSEQQFNPELESLEYDGLENVAGYICKRLRAEVPNIAVEGNDDNYSWVNHLSEGGLSKPTQELMVHLRAMQNVFNDINDVTLLICDNFLQKHIERSQHVKCDVKKKNYFFGP